MPRIHVYPDVEAVSVIQGCPQRYGRQKQKYAQKLADQLAWHTVETRSAERPKHSLTLECNYLPFATHLEHNSLHKFLVEHVNEDNSEHIAQTPLRSNICKVLIFLLFWKACLNIFRRHPPYKKLNHSQEILLEI